MIKKSLTMHKRLIPKLNSIQNNIKIIDVDKVESTVWHNNNICHLSSLTFKSRTLL